MNRLPSEIMTASMCSEVSWGIIHLSFSAVLIGACSLWNICHYALTVHRRESTLISVPLSIALGRMAFTNFYHLKHRPLDVPLFLVGSVCSSIIRLMDQFKKINLARFLLLCRNQNRSIGNKKSYFFNNNVYFYFPYFYSLFFGPLWFYLTPSCFSWKSRR